eukprot:1945575-Rhodomonas_salina.1
MPLIGVSSGWGPTNDEMASIFLTGLLFSLLAMLVCYWISIWMGGEEEPTFFIIPPGDSSELRLIQYNMYGADSTGALPEGRWKEEAFRRAVRALEYTPASEERDAWVVWGQRGGEREDGCKEAGGAELKEEEQGARKGRSERERGVRTVSVAAALLRDNVQ